MNARLRGDAEYIIREAISANDPAPRVAEALAGKNFPGRVFLLGVGKAAYPMSKAASESLKGRLTRGIVISKYGHIPEPVPGLECFEAGHPVPDENTLKATRAALDMTRGLVPSDTVLVLLSGGGSSLFEDPLIPWTSLSGSPTACWPAAAAYRR